MKHFYHRQLWKILKLLARLTVARFQPLIVGVTGTVGKTSSKEAIFTVLSGEKRTRRNLANLNNRLGLPLSILGNYESSGNVFFWMFAISRALLNLILPKALVAYPEALVLEYAGDRPGDIKYLLSVVRPNISLITAVGDIPVHVEFYENADAVAREKSRLVEALPSAANAILNADDPRVLAMKDRVSAKATTYGFSPVAQVRILDLENHIETNTAGLSRPTGISFKLQYNGAVVPVRLQDTAGTSQAYAAGAAAGVGLACGLNLVQISEALSNYKPPAQRLNFLDGAGGILLVDDSYNASPLSMANAITTIKDLPAKRKVAILGNMRELGKFSEQAHRQIGKLAGEVFDIIITVGEDAKFIEAEAKKTVPSRTYRWFTDADSALAPIKELLKPGDLVLVKSSHTIGLDKIAEELK